ncbi:MAG: type VI secretion system baseplate subunit TssG [Alphaproteobacteria bacterium]|nr:type VI secretion system baseplate subunit TssG [Alphaproteobacteria bacterium]
MSSADRREDAPLIQRLREEPQAFDPLQALLTLERYAAAESDEGRSRHGAPVGRDAHPAQEALRFVAEAAMAFPAAELTSYREEAGSPPTLGVSFIGMHGPSGVMPYFYSELILARLREKDTALAAFFDLFLHRAASFFLRAWTKYRLTAQTPPDDAAHGLLPAEAGVSGLIDAVIGFGTQGLVGRLAPPQAALRFYAGALAGNPRSAVVLEAILSDYFAERIRVDTFAPHWLRLPESERTKLVPHGFCRLGDEAVIGEKIMRPEGAYRIELGPLAYARFRMFLPDREPLRQLVHFARLFAGEALYFDVRLSLRKEDVPPLKLGDWGGGDGPRLGWNTWVSNLPAVEHKTDTLLSCDRVA